MTSRFQLIQFSRPREEKRDGSQRHGSLRSQVLIPALTKVVSARYRLIKKASESWISAAISDWMMTSNTSHFSDRFRFLIDERSARDVWTDTMVINIVVKLSC
mmetsp:Transcript_8271/g.17137  ORF Transcript_8271/g.17137 Transcript_8271/m.17137 type:complete len:103 (+) Transcript_8271:1533-1841(+)